MCSTGIIIFDETLLQPGSQEARIFSLDLQTDECSVNFLMFLIIIIINHSLVIIRIRLSVAFAPSFFIFLVIILLTKNLNPHSHVLIVVIIKRHISFIPSFSIFLVDILRIFQLWHVSDHYHYLQQPHHHPYQALRCFCSILFHVPHHNLTHWKF